MDLQRNYPLLSHTYRRRSWGNLEELLTNARRNWKLIFIKAAQAIKKVGVIWSLSLCGPWGEIEGSTVKSRMVEFRCLFNCFFT